jgi:hypothetical protein
MMGGSSWLRTGHTAGFFKYDNGPSDPFKDGNSDKPRKGRSSFSRRHRYSMEYVAGMFRISCEGRAESAKCKWKAFQYN